MRFAIWAAVSTRAQADENNKDKESLPNQEKTCRNTARSKGWIEAAGPFIVPGKSRTRWVNLRDAENEIPQLKAMLESAAQKGFDVLVMYDYNRLRDLLDPVSKTLDAYGVQRYSINQPIEPITPEKFKPHVSDSESIMRGMNQVYSRMQIADLQRKYEQHVPARARRGLYALRIPWGYTRSDSGIPNIVPSQARIVIEIKDMWLEGKSSRVILAHLNKHYPTPREAGEWSRPTIVTMLKNPFYAGKTSFGRYKVVRDPYNNTKQVLKNQTPIVLADGQHEALYSWEDYQAILAEFERRANLPNANHYTFSGLLICSVCSRRLYHWKEKKGGLWRCAYPREGGGKNHILLWDTEAMRIIPLAIQKAVEDLNVLPEPHLSQTLQDEDVLNDLRAQRKKIQTFAEKGIYNPDEAAQKIKAIEQQVAALKDVEQKRRYQDAKRRQWMLATQEIKRNLSEVPDTIREENPREVNQILLRLCRAIVISPAKEVIEVLWPI
jgi:hypothetical protein